MFVGQGASGLPEDRFVNTFHFVCIGTATAEQQEDACVLVRDFYNGTGSGPTVQFRALSTYISPYVSRTAELRSYDLETEKPRVPQITPLTLGTPYGSSGLPEEVAVCLSYHGPTPITARRRGRIYIGPLTVNAALAATDSDCTRVASNLYQDLAATSTMPLTRNGGGARTRTPAISGNRSSANGIRRVSYRC
jgi:hypothetical protein